MKLKIIVAACALVTSGVVMADTYQAEVGAKVFRFNDSEYANDYNLYQVDGSYYFNGVNTDNVPLAEAAYLGKNSNVFASAIHYPNDGFGVNGNGYSLGAELYIPESFLYVSAAVSRTSFPHYTSNDWSTSVGITPIEGLLIKTVYDHDAGYDANIYGKYVTDFGNGQFINIEAGITDSDFGTIKEIGADFYFDKTFSIGGAISDQRSDNSYIIRTRKFFTESFSGELSYTDSSDKTEGNIVMAGLNIRF